MKTKAVFVMLLFTTVLLTACSGIPDSQVDYNTVEDKLEILDAFNAQIQEEQPVIGKVMFEYGTSMEKNIAYEELPLNEKYDNALEYTGASLYSYDMLRTYWFNANNQLYSVSHSMQNDAFTQTVDSLMKGLRSDYKEYYLQGYYNTENVAVEFASKAEALAAIDSSQAYYYAAFSDISGIQIEFYAQKEDQTYGFWIYYTDYTYYQ